MRDEYLDAHPLVPVTTTTITDRNRLLRELGDVREQGYATDHASSIQACHVSRSPPPGSTALVLSAPEDRFEAHFDEYLRAARLLVSRLSEPEPDWSAPG